MARRPGSRCRHPGGSPCTARRFLKVCEGLGGSLRDSGFAMRTILGTRGLEPIRNSEFGARRTDFGVRSTEDGVRSTEFGARSSEFGVRSSEFGVRSSEEFGVRSTEFGVRSTEFVLRT